MGMLVQVTLYAQGPGEARRSLSGIQTRAYFMPLPLPSW